MTRKRPLETVKLNALLEAASEEMATTLRRRLLSHPGELGSAREEIVREFLRSLLPKRFEVSTGFAFDCAGRISRQLDIVIFDADVCPRFGIPGGKFIFPCEAVIAVGQVKSSLTSRQQLNAVLENLASVKSLDRSANGAAFDFFHKERLSPADNHLHHVFTFLLVTGNALDSETMAEALLERAFGVLVQELPNVIIALDKYLVTYCCDDGVCPNPMLARGVAVQSEGRPSDVLLRFYLLLGQALNVIRTAQLPYWEYLRKYRDIPATVFHSTVETPPPHLGRWSEGG
jgi:hypothetical protein